MHFDAFPIFTLIRFNQLADRVALIRLISTIFPEKYIIFIYKKFVYLDQYKTYKRPFTLWVPLERRLPKTMIFRFGNLAWFIPGFILRITPVCGVVGSPMMDGTGKWTEVDGKRTPWHSYMTDWPPWKAGNLCKNARFNSEQSASITDIESQVTAPHCIRTIESVVWKDCEKFDVDGDMSLWCALCAEIEILILEICIYAWISIWDLILARTRFIRMKQIFYTFYM